MVARSKAVFKDWSNWLRRLEKESEYRDCLELRMKDFLEICVDCTVNYSMEFSETMIFDSGPVMSTEAEYSRTHFTVGLNTPRPPNKGVRQSNYEHIIG